MSRLDRARELSEERDVDSILEQVIAARKGGNDPKELFGGPRDWIDSMVPPAVLVIAKMIFDLDVAVKAAIGAIVLVVLVRLARRETLRHAFSGVVGVGIGLLIVKMTGDVGNYVIPGIIINGIYALAFLASVAFRRPLVGVIMRLFSDKPKAYHEHPRVRRAYLEVTLLWALTFILRGGVQELFRQAGKDTLAVGAKIALGYPLYLGALALTMPYIRWRTKDVPVPEPEPGELASEDLASEDAAEGEPEPAGEHAE
jgi:hypothetical protein